MAGDDDLASRVLTLENLTAHQQAMLDELSGELTKQWDQIDRLNRTVIKLHEQAADHASRLDAPAANVKPPHY